MKYIPARFFTPANRTSIDLLVVHTAECAEVASAAENLQSWTAGPNASRASWHYAVDNDSVTQSVLEKDIAWHAGPVNGYSIGIEHAGRASQDAAGWADDYSRAVLENSAKLAAEICVRWNIPIQKLGAEDLKAGRRRGICGHVDVTNGLTGGKGHWDPGPGFPWVSWLARVREHADAIRANAVDPKLPPAVVLAPREVPPEFSSFVPVEHAGSTWLVAPIYVAPVAIGQAQDLARALGCELPSPGLVDAIWRAADLKIDGTKMIRKHDGTPKTMDAPEVHADQAARLARLVGSRSLGVDFRLLAGAFKDVVVRDGRVGLYGWQRPDGSVIQSFFGGHARAWRDYSQGLRLVRKA